jgi:hypothetical protein
VNFPAREQYLVWVDSLLQALWSKKTLASALLHVESANGECQLTGGPVVPDVKRKTDPFGKIDRLSYLLRKAKGLMRSISSRTLVLLLRTFIFCPIFFLYDNIQSTSK